MPDQFKGCGFVAENGHYAFDSRFEPYQWKNYTMSVNYLLFNYGAFNVYGIEWEIKSAPPPQVVRALIISVGCLM